MRIFACLAACVTALAASAVPAAAVVAPPTTLDPYEMFTIGDSYAAGEGAPDVDGQYNDSGDRTGDFEDWDTRFGGSPATPGPNQDSTRCHRSGHTSTSAVARSLLQAQFPDVRFDWTSVACSGGSIVQTGVFKPPAKPNKGGVLRPYDGVEKLGKRGIAPESLSPDAYPPQIEQLNTIVGDRPAGATKRIDALVMNLGGNDAGFGEIITACLNIDPFAGTSSGNCNENTEVRSFIDTKLGILSGRFDRLDASLRGQPGTGDPGLQHTPRDVFLTAAPNPLRPTADTFCSHRPEGNYEENLTAEESSFLEDRVLRPLNGRFATEATQHGWKLVDGHVNRFIGHAICTPFPDNWINTNVQSLRKQGELDETTGVPIAVGGGIVHPTVDGYEAIGAALAERMRPFVIDRYTAEAAPATTTVARSSGFTVTMSDANLEALRSGYWHRVKLRQLNFDGTVTNVLPPDGLRDVRYGLGSIDHNQTGRYFVTTRACGPVSRDGTVGCGPASAELRVSTFVPARPVNLTAAAGDAPAAVMPTPGFTVKWAHANGFALHDTRRSVVRVRRAGSLTPVVTKTLEGSLTSMVVKDLQAGVDYLVSVKACNDGGRCSSFTPEIQTRASKGAEPFSGLFFELQKIKVAIQGVPCSTTPVQFDPNLGPGTPGFDDPTPTFQPACATEPPVGRLRLAHTRLNARAGRPVTVELRWRHPHSWRSIHAVDVQLRRPQGALATLRFDQDADKLRLGKRTRTRGRALAVGRSGTLSVRGVKVRLAKDAVRGSGPKGRNVRLRFKLVLGPSAGRSVVVAVGATDDTGQVQPVTPAGVIHVR